MFLKLLTVGLLFAQTPSVKEPPTYEDKYKGDISYNAPLFTSIIVVENATGEPSTVSMEVKNGAYRMVFNDPTNTWRCYPLTVQGNIMQFTCTKPYKMVGE